MIRIAIGVFLGLLLFTTCAKASPIYVEGCSGVAIGNNYILTAGHCINGSGTTVKLDKEDKSYWEADTIWTNQRLDFAVIRTNKYVTPADDEAGTKEKKEDKTLDLPASKVSCAKPDKAKNYLVKGWPFGEYAETRGYVAAGEKKRFMWPVSYLLAGPGFFGSSGSPVFNEAGEVEMLLVGGVMGSGIFIVVPTTEICNVLPR